MSHIYDAGTTTTRTVYIAATGTTQATSPLTTNSSGYVIDANAARVWYDEGSVDRVVDGETHTFQAVSGLSPGGRELAYASNTSSSLTVTSTTAVDVSGVSISFTGDGRPVWLSAGALFQIGLGTGTAGQTARIEMKIVDTDASNAEVLRVEFGATLPSSGASFATLRNMVRLGVVAAGTTRNFKAQANVGAVSNASCIILANASWPIHLAAEAK